MAITDANVVVLTAYHSITGRVSLRDSVVRVHDITIARLNTPAKLVERYKTAVTNKDNLSSCSRRQSRVRRVGAAVPARDRSDCHVAQSRLPQRDGRAGECASHSLHRQDRAAARVLTARGTFVRIRANDDEQEEYAACVDRDERPWGGSRSQPKAAECRLGVARLKA